MQTMFLDFETSSDVDLKKCGVDLYVGSVFFEVICACVLLVNTNDSDGWVNKGTWTYVDGVCCAGWLEARKPKVLVAHNLDFELAVLHRIGLGHWERDCALFDTACVSRRMDTGSSLEDACKAWNTCLKSPDGSSLIKKWLCGVKVIPDEALQKIVAYCEQDVQCLYELYKFLYSYSHFNEEEFRCHRRINRRGFCVDMGVVELIEKESTQALAELKRNWSERALAITSVGQGNPNSTPCRRALSKALGGSGLESWAKDSKDFEAAPEALKIFVDDYNDLAAASFKKLGSIRENLGAQGRLRDAFLFDGQRTGRFSSYGVQLHNLPRSKYTYEEINKFLERPTRLEGREYLDILRSSIRGAFQAPPGRVLVVGDFSQIELRLQALLTEEEWVLRIFRSGGDLYQEAAARMFGCSVDAVTKEQRQRGKVATLALGYGSGVVGLVRAGYPLPSAQPGVDPLDKVAEDVELWRSNRPKTCSAWQKLDSAARECVKKSCHAGFLRRIQLSQMVHVDMSCQLTKGAGNVLHADCVCSEESVSLFWTGCRVEERTSDTRKQLKYRRGLVDGVPFWGGTIFENICQALAARCLKRALRSCEDAGLEVVAHVHDEIVVECDVEKQEQVKAALAAAMNLRNFNGLLKADVWSGRRYGKG